MRYFVVILILCSSIFSDTMSDYYDEQGSRHIFKIRSKPNLLLAVLMSTVLPGTGQLYLGRKRGYLYLAADLGLGFNFARNTALKIDTRRRYRDFAYKHAKARYSNDGKFYEYMKYFRSSDEYNEATRQESWYYYWYYGISEEERESHYNYWTAGEEDYWYWDSKENMDEFSSLMSKTNIYAQHANIFLGLMAANRLVSAIDALFTAKKDRQKSSKKQSNWLPKTKIDPFNCTMGFYWVF